MEKSAITETQPDAITAKNNMVTHVLIKLIKYQFAPKIPIHLSHHPKTSVVMADLSQMLSNNAMMVTITIMMVVQVRAIRNLDTSASIK